MEASFTPGIASPRPRGRRAHLEMSHTATSFAYPLTLSDTSDIDKDFSNETGYHSEPSVDLYNDPRFENILYSPNELDDNLHASHARSHSSHARSHSHSNTHSLSHSRSLHQYDSSHGKIKQDDNTINAIIDSYEDVEPLHAPVPHRKPPHTILANEPRTQQRITIADEEIRTRPTHHSEPPQQRYVRRESLERNVYRGGRVVVNSPRVSASPADGVDRGGKREMKPRGDVADPDPVVEGGVRPERAVYLDGGATQTHYNQGSRLRDGRGPTPLDQAAEPRDRTSRIDARTVEAAFAVRDSGDDPRYVPPQRRELTPRDIRQTSHLLRSSSPRRHHSPPPRQNHSHAQSPRDDRHAMRGQEEYYGEEEEDEEYVRPPTTRDRPPHQRRMPLHSTPHHRRDDRSVTPTPSRAPSTRVSPADGDTTRSGDATWARITAKGGNGASSALSDIERSQVQRHIQELTKMFMSASAKNKQLTRDNFIEWSAQTLNVLDTAGVGTRIGPDRAVANSDEEAEAMEMVDRQVINLVWGTMTRDCQREMTQLGVDLLSTRSNQVQYKQRSSFSLKYKA